MIEIIPIAREQLPAVQTYAANPIIGATTHVPSPYPPNGAVEWFETVSARRAAGQARVFSIMIDEQFCGVMTLNDINPEKRTASLDFWVAVEFQGRGVATEAARLAVSHASSVLGLKNLFSTCLATNEASARVLEKTGFIESTRMAARAGKFEGQELRVFRLELIEYKS